MKQPTFFPYYSIHSDIVKVSLGLKDERSIRKHFEAAGITIRHIGGKEVVYTDELINASGSQEHFVNYTPIGQSSKKLDVLK
jgi:hypothetical protein